MPFYIGNAERSEKRRHGGAARHRTRRCRRRRLCRIWRIILGGAETTGPQRFYDIRQQVWRAEGIGEPNMGRRLRGLFREAGFSRTEASAHYISYGTPARIIAFAHDRAAECRNQQLQAAVARHGIAPVEEFTRLAGSWEEWGRDAGAFFAFPWCRVLAWC